MTRPGTDIKNILILIVGLVLFSCNQKTKSKEKKIPIKLNVILPTDNMEILGNWKMCSSYENGIMEQFNVCPTISFLASGFGFVSNASLTTEHFTWMFEKGKLNIYVNGNTPTSTFPDTFYFAGIYTDNNLKNLIISTTKNNSRFFLSK